MRIYAIFAHDRHESLNGQIFFALVNQFKALGHDVDILDLYAREDEIPFYHHERAETPEGTFLNNPFFKENKQRFMAADRLLIVHPIYWYSLPGILKTWIDLITNYAWHYEGGFYARGLHNIKKVFVVNTSNMPLWYRRSCTENPAMVQMRETFKFFGVPKIGFYQIGHVGALTEKTVNDHITRAMKQSRMLL